MEKKKSKIGRKTRNTISGLLVGAASLFAVSTYMEVPGDEMTRFLLTSILFFVLIFALAGLAILIFKLPGILKRKFSNSEEDAE